MVIGSGGARAMIDPLVSFFESLGGEMLMSSTVDEITINRNRATGVVTADGEKIKARTIIANLTPKVLFGRLVPHGSVDDGFSGKVKNFKHGPGTMMVHLAMEDLPPWTSPEARDYAYVHIGPYLEDMSRAYQQAMAGLLPVAPTLVVGQPTTADPSRAPEGKHVLWVQVRVVPGEIRGDAAGTIQSTDWDEAKDTYADRVMGIIETYAPGIGEMVLDRTVFSPVDLEAMNPNLIGGDSLGGSHHLMQHFFLRPFPGWTKYRTPIKNLYMCGASTWPGAGVGAGSGYLLGKMLTAPGPLDRIKALFRR